MKFPEIRAIPLVGQPAPPPRSLLVRHSLSLPGSPLSPAVSLNSGGEGERRLAACMSPPLPFWERGPGGEGRRVQAPVSCNRAIAHLAAVFALVVLCLLPAKTFAQSYADLSAQVREMVSVSEPAVALIGVRVVDGTGAAPAENQTVVIQDGRISAVGASNSVQVPAGARRIELPGHTVLPGIIGLHDHTFYMTPRRSIQADFTAPRLYLASGVTTIRTTGSASPYNELTLKDGIETGAVPGPTMVITGPYITGQGGGGQMYAATTPDAARRVVAYWAEEGVEWFKFYTSISREAMKAAIDEAHARGAKFTGHLCSVSFREAVALGIDNLEHGFITNSDYAPGKQPDQCPSTVRAGLEAVDLEGVEVQATIRDMIDNDVAMTTTPAVYELFVPNRPPLEDRNLEAMSAETREEYMGSRNRIAANPQSGIAEALFKKALAFDRMFWEAGGLLAAGVDPTGSGGALPGYGDQRNYELLIEGGFSPVEAIQILTLNGAKVLGTDSELGSVEAGKIADLVVIEGDPVARPAEIRNVRTVFKHGVGYDSAKLIEAVKGQVGIR